MFHFQTEIGALSIEDSRLDPTSCDDIPALLLGLQWLYADQTTRQVLWGIWVMGILKQGLNGNFDRLHEWVNKHSDIQAFLGHGAYTPYKRSPVINNVSLLSSGDGSR